MPGYNRDSLKVKPATPVKYIMLVDDVINHQGDQRSRDFPGHGYPAYQESVTRVEKYSSDEELKEAILKENRKYVIYAVTPVTINISTAVSIALN